MNVDPSLLLLGNHILKLLNLAQEVLVYLPCFVDSLFLLLNLGFMIRVFLIYDVFVDLLHFLEACVGRFKPLRIRILSFV